MGNSSDDARFYPPPPEAPPELWPDPRLALTMGEMRARGWSIRATCDRCRVVLWCDTGQMVQMLGTGAFMWGQRGKCRVMIGPTRCHGYTTFEAKTRRSDGWYPLHGSMMTRARHLLILRTKKQKSAPAG